MKRTIVKIGKTGKRITAILGFIIAVCTCWGLYQKFTTKNISGQWKLEFKVENSSYKAYIGETYGYKVYFKQNEGSINGIGEKWENNGKELPFNQHRKIEYTGTISGSTLKAVYTLYGSERETQGTMEVEIDGDKLKGTFSGTAADAKGIVIGERIAS